MSNKIRINTDKTIELAKKIKTENKKMNEQYNEIKSEINILRNFWNSKSANNIFESMQKCNKKERAKRDVLNNYSKYLLGYVSDGYVEVEETNKSLADSFK